MTVKDLLHDQNLITLAILLFAVNYLFPKVKELLRPTLSDEDKKNFNDIVKSIDNLTSTIGESVHATERELKEIDRKSENIIKISSDLYDMHSQKGVDGVPRWWVSPNIEKNQEKIISRSDQIIKTQSDIAHTLERIADKLTDKHE